MDSLEIEPDFISFQETLNSLPNFYKTSYGHLKFKNENNDHEFLNLNSEEISDILLVLEELDKAIQINIDEINIDNCDEIISILSKSNVKPHQKSVNHKISKKSIFKPLKKPKKIFLKVLRDDSPSKDTQITNCNSKKTEKTAASTTLKSNNNIGNVSEKISIVTNK